MVAIKAYYDGKYFVPLDERKFRLQQTAIIVVEDDVLSEKTSSCRGLASDYAKPELIQFEEELIATTFSGN